MKKVSLLIFVSLILLLAFASCQFFGGGHEHEWSDATCSTPKTCLGCGETEGEALGHDWTAATCTSPATCKTCEATEGAALGHQWRDATCTVSKTCLVCNETEGAPLGHKNDIVLPAEAATCTKTGLTEGVKCSACQTITTPQETVPKTAHTEETVPGKAASCTDTGLSDGKKCTVCGTVTVEQEILPTVSHSEETLPAKAPTCTEDGLKEGKKCTVCGTVTVVQEKVPATGHQNTTKYDKEEPTCTEDGLSAGEYCNDCQTWLTEREVLEAPGHEERATPTVTTNPASCTAEGSIVTEYKCKFCGETVRSTSEPIEKIPHNWGEYSYNEDATCGVDGTKTATCTYGCGTPNTITAEGTALVHTAPDDAVCGEEWTCKYCNNHTEVLAHDYADATCQVLATCKKCGETTGDYADCVPGTPVEEDRVEPKCGVEGSYNEVVYCTVCNKELSSTPKSIAALEHIMGEATCKEPATCTREDCTYTEGEPRDNHDVKMSYSNGELKYYCASGCDDVVFTVETEKLVYDGSAAPGYTFYANGNMPVSYANGYYEYLFTPTGDKPTEAASANGWGYNSNSKLHGAQPMFWIPTNDGTKDVVFDGFSCENNAFGVISFKLKTSMTSDYTVAIAKNRSPENKTEFPSSSFNDWAHSSINLLTIGAVKEGADSIAIKGGLDGSNYAMGTIPVVDGWSEWFEVKLFIYLKDNNTITVGYYINDEFYGSYVRDLVNPDGHMTIDSLDVRALYINGWTYEPGTGLALDDIAFGYTTNSEWHFDECAHNFTTKTVAPGCETGGYTTYSCSICGLVENRDFTDATGHEITHVDAKAPTCIAVGWEAYDKCENCDYTTYVELEMVDHTPGAAVEENRTEATCIADGKYDSVVYCTVDGCGKEISRETIVIKCTGHIDTDRVVPAEAATCTNTGLTEGEYCEACQTWLKNQDIIPTIDHTPEVVPGKAATCTDTGLTDGSKCSVCNKELQAQVEIPVVAHTYDDDQDADCNVCGATRDVACLHENIVAVGEAKDATCKETGITAGEKCADCGEVLTAQQVIEKLAHTVVVDAAVDATCTETGLTEGSHCSVCDEVIKEQSVVPTLGHLNDVALAEKAPTCTETGLTAGVKCSRCGVETTPQTVLDALGHTWVDATCDAAKTCSVCGVTDGDPLPSHTLSNTLVDGKLVYECDTCDKSFAITHTQYYTDGSSLSGFTFNDAKTNASYKGDTNAPEAITVDGNTYYQFLRDTEKGTTVDGASATGQATMWIPAYHNSANPGLKNLSAADGSILLVSFDVDFAMSKNLTLNLVYGAPSTGETWYASPLGKIMEAPINFYSQTDAEGNYTSVRLYGWNNVVIVEKTFAADDVFTAFGSTGWFNVQLAIELDAANDMLIGHYYIDGAYVTTQCVENTLENNMITAVQFDGTSEPVNSGYRFDNFAVGYTNGAEWTLDTCEHNYVAGETVAPTCDDDGYTPYTCELCGHVVNRDIVEATGHVGGVATCIAAGVCTACGEDYIPALGHDVSIANNGGKLTYTCDRCQVAYKIETEGVYYDGTNASFANYVGGNSKYNGGTNKLVSEDGAFKAITDIDATVNSDSQMQLWFPNTKDYTSNGVNFNKLTLANASTGVLSFKLNVKLLGTNDFLSFKIVDNAWGSAGCIDCDIINIRPVFTGSTVTAYALRGWSNDPTNLSQSIIANLPAGEDFWTGWFDFKAVFTFDPTTANITMLYYINDQYVGSGVKQFTTTSQKLACVYSNLNAWVAGTGYYIDDLAFGHTASGHWMLDDKAHNFTPATCSAPASCSCGWTGVALADHNIGAPTYDAATNTVAYKCSDCNTVCNMTGYYYDGSNTDFFYQSNGNMPVDTSNGYYEYIFTTTPGENGEEVQDTAHGWYQNTNNSKWGAQPMFWIPNREHEQGLDGFTCENNVSGKISFRMRTNMTDPYNLAIGKERGYSNWSSDGGWSLNYNIFQIGGYSESGVTLNAVLNGTTALATIPAAGDGWSEWFTVEMQITLSSAGTISIDYYINGELKGSASKAQYVVPSTGKYLDLRAIYINGWTYAAGTGLALDDFTFAYHTHNTFDGRVHNVTSATCLEKESCSCGWVGEAGAHSFGEGCAPCTLCGASNPAAPHANLAPSYVNGVQYACADCGYAYKLEGYHYFDGTSATDANGGTLVNASGDTTSFTMDLSNGYVDMTNKTGAASNTQSQLWFPSMNDTPDTLTDFSAANNSIGFVSFRIKPSNDNIINLILAERRNGSGWVGWSDSSINTLQIEAVSNNSVTIKGGANNYTKLTLKTVSLAENDGWIDIVIKIDLKSDNTYTLTFFINGENCGSDTQALNITTGKIRAVYIKNNSTALGAGYCLDDIVIGYDNSGMSEYEAPLYKEVIAAENVTSETLTTIVDSKIKQVDQATLDTGSNSNENGWFTKEGGTPVYVLAEGKDGTDVEALYFSRSEEYDWTTYASADQNAGWSEFRFDTTGTVTSFSFDYLVRGTTEYKEENGADFDGNTVVLGNSYVQVKDSTSDYVEVAGDALVTDGEWHTITVDLGEGQSLTNVLVKLYHFYGEMLIANLNVEYVEA